MPKKEVIKIIDCVRKGIGSMGASYFYEFVFAKDDVCKEFHRYITLFNAGFCLFCYVRWRTTQLSYSI